MGKVLTDKQGVFIGAFTFPDRKKPSLAIQEGNKCTIYGNFKSTEAADEFMDRLGHLVGAIKEDAEDVK